MSSHNATINAVGEVDPMTLSISRSHTVTYLNQSGDTAKIIYHDDSIFGQSVYQVANEATLELTVQSGAPSGQFDYQVQTRLKSKDGSPCVIID